MWSGIWPPSKPLMATPSRLPWPFWPRPDGLALARADTTADPHPAVTGAFVVAEIVQFHGRALAFALFALVK